MSLILLLASGIALSIAINWLVFSALLKYLAP